jgi:hypothetical protein
MSTVQNAAASPAKSNIQRPWIARHKFLTTIGLLILIVLVGFYFLGWPLVKWRYHKLFNESLAEIQHNPAAVQRLGEPISVPWSPLPSGRVFQEGDRGDARFDFTVLGPKGTAQAVSIMRMIGGKWGFTQLELEFPDKQELHLAQAIDQGGDDTPKFDPNAKQPDVKAPDLPVDIKLPDLPDVPQK